MARTGARRHAWGVALVLALAGAVSGCAWKPYVATRAVRHFTGSPTRTHVVTPLTADLGRYRVVELHALENMLPGLVPAAAQQRLNDGLARAAGRLGNRLEVQRVTELSALLDAGQPSAGPVLVVEGELDDYEPGSRPLRIAELGFNHMSVTVRVRVRDKATSAVLGAATVTAMDDRDVATINGVIDRAVAHVGAFLAGGHAS